MNMKNLWQNILQYCYKKPLKRGMYAIKEGDKAGGFILYINEYNLGASYAFLFVPDPMTAVYFTKEEINNNIKFKILELVSILPKDVYEVCRANFTYYADKEGLVYES